MEQLIPAGRIVPGDTLKVLTYGKVNWHYVAHTEHAGDIIRIHSGSVVLNRHQRELVTVRHGE